MTQIVIVDEQDRVIGSKDRDEVTPTDIFRVAALWVTDNHGHILLAQRKGTKKIEPGKWDMAVAGTVELGETYQSNIIREAREELGLTGVQLDMVSKLRLSQPAYSLFCQCFTVVTGTPLTNFVFQKEEIESIKWFTRLELHQALEEASEAFTPKIDWALENL